MSCAGSSRCSPRSAPTSPKSVTGTSGAPMIRQVFTCWTGMPGDPSLLIHPLNMPLKSSDPLMMHAANARQAGKRKLRWPVTEVIVVTNAEPVKGAIERLNAVCMDRANARKISVVMGRWDRIGWHAEPVMKALGKGFGKNSFKVKGAHRGCGRQSSQGGDQRRGGPLNWVEERGRSRLAADHVTFTEKLPAEVFSAPMQDATVYVDVGSMTASKRKGMNARLSAGSRRCANNSILSSVSSSRGLKQYPGLHLL